jgi:hypothetical protein
MELKKRFERLVKLQNDWQTDLDLYKQSIYSKNSLREKKNHDSDSETNQFAKKEFFVKWFGGERMESSSKFRIDYCMQQCIRYFQQLEGNDNHPERLIGKRSTDRVNISELNQIFVRDFLEYAVDVDFFLVFSQFMIDASELQIQYWDSFYSVILHCLQFTEIGATQQKKLILSIVTAFENEREVLPDSTYCNDFISKKRFEIFLLLLRLVDSPSKSSILISFHDALLKYYSFHNVKQGVTCPKMEGEYFCSGVYEKAENRLAVIQFYFIQLFNSFFQSFASSGEMNQIQIQIQTFLSCIIQTKSWNLCHQLLSRPKLFFVLSLNDEFLMNYLYQSLLLDIQLKNFPSSPSSSLSSLSPSSSLSIVVEQLTSSHVLSPPELDFVILMTSIFMNDGEMIIDFLSNNETCLLEYLLVFFKSSSQDRCRYAAEDWNDRILPQVRVEIQEGSFAKKNNQVTAVTSSSNHKNQNLLWHEEIIQPDSANISQNLLPIPVKNYSLVVDTDENSEESDDERINADDVLFATEVDIEAVWEMLNDLPISVERLYRAGLFPFDPAPLCRRIRSFIS